MSVPLERPHSHTVELESGFTAHIYCRWMRYELDDFVKSASIVVIDPEGKEQEIGAIDGPIPYEEANDRGARIAKAWFAERFWRD